MLPRGISYCSRTQRYRVKRLAHLSYHYALSEAEQVLQALIGDHDADDVGRWIKELRAYLAQSHDD